MNPMKLAFSTLGCPKWSFEEILQNAQRLGFSGIEIRGIQDDIETQDVWCFRPENQQKAQELLRTYDVDIIGIGTSCAFHAEDIYDDAITQGKIAIDIAKKMQIPNIRVFGNEVPKGEDEEVVVQRVIQGIEELCQYGQETGLVNILLEIHGDFNTIEMLQPVTDALGAYSNFGIIWDVEHSYTSYDQDFLPFYESIKPWIRHVHFKDATRDRRNRRTIHLPGEGSIPLQEIYNTLENDGYDSYYSFEWEKRWHPDLAEPEKAFPAYVEFMRTLQ